MSLVVTKESFVVMQIHQGYQGSSAPEDARATVVGREGGGCQLASSEQVVAFIEQVIYLIWHDVPRSAVEFFIRKASFKKQPTQSFCLNLQLCSLVVPVPAVFIYMSSNYKELSLGLSLRRPGKVITNLPGCPAPKSSRKNGSL